MRKAAAPLFSMLLLFAATPTANAAIISSIDRATFQASTNAGTIDVQNFDGLLDGTILGTLGGVTYAASGGDPIVTDAFLTTTSPNGLGSTSIGFFLDTESATFLFASPITAFAIDINTFATTNGAYRADVSTGDSVTSIFEVFPGAATGQFIGFVSDTAFNAVTISALTGFSYTLDTLAFGDANDLVDPEEIPEPGTLLLLSGGLFGIAMARRRRVQRSTRP